MLPKFMGWVGWRKAGSPKKKELLGQYQLPLAGDPQAIDLTAMDDFELFAPLQQQIAVNLAAGSGDGFSGLWGARWGCLLLGHRV